MIVLRNYQQDIKRSVLREWETVCSTLVVAPTGCGKTVMFAAIIEAMQPKRAMVLAHRSELIWQARDKIMKTTGLDCGVEMADKYVNGSLFGDTPVVVSTIQTQLSAHGDRRRMSRFNPEDFGLLIIDEAHRSLSPGYRDLINYYKTKNPSIKILGVTATPDLSSEEALGQVYETCPPEQDYEILQAIQDGWLVDVEQQFVHIAGLDFASMRTTAGDLNGADLAAVMEAEENMQGVAGAALGVIGEKRTVVFTASVKQAEVISNIFNRHKPGMSNWVCGATNKDLRREMLSRFDAGQFQVICNCNCLSEGWDSPGVEVVVQARPTKSRALYAQQVGRSLRPLPGVVDGPETPELRRAAIAASPKKSALVLDFVGNSGKHKLMTSADILGGKLSEEVLARAVAKAKSRGGPVNMTEELLAAEEELRKEAEERRLAEEARKRRLVAKVRYTTKAISPFDAFDLQPVQARGWDQGKQLSEKQRSVLLRAGVNPDTLSFSQGKQLLNEMFRRFGEKLATVKQCAILKRYNYQTKDMKMEDASKLIDRLAKNQWRRIDAEPVDAVVTKEDERVPF